MTAVRVPTGNAHLETNLEEFFRKRVRLVGGYAFKFVPLVAGTPDRIVFMPGNQTYLVELKQRGKKPSAIQQVWHDRLALLGHKVVVLDNKEDVLAWIREIVGYSDPQKGKPGPRPKA